MLFANCGEHEQESAFSDRWLSILSFLIRLGRLSPIVIGSLNFWREFTGGLALMERAVLLNSGFS